MTKIEAELLFQLCHLPQWKAYMDYKQDRLNKLYKEMEYEVENIKRLQGRCAEINDDLNLKNNMIFRLEK